MTDAPDNLTPEEVDFLDAHSGTQPLPALEVERMLATGRLEAAQARYPEVPHIDKITAAFPEHARNAFTVSRFIDYATVDSLGGEVGVREYLEAGLDPSPVIHLAEQFEQWDS